MKLKNTKQKMIINKQFQREKQRENRLWTRKHVHQLIGWIVCHQNLRLIYAISEFIMKYETKCLNQILSVFACSDSPIEKKNINFINNATYVEQKTKNKIKQFTSLFPFRI